MINSGISIPAKPTRTRRIRHYRVRAEKAFQIVTIIPLFLESEVGIFLIETGKLEAARQVLARLKGEIV
jgi:hypothetical protein